MKNTIIQWNCRGLRANYDELQLLLNDYDPAVVCLQETYLKEPNNFTDDVNDKGRIIENFINKNNLCLYNNKTPTYLHPATGTYTFLDLSICYPTLLLDYEWKVHDDLCGRDHFPIFLNNIAPQLEQPITRWKLTKAYWPSFKAVKQR